MLLIILKLIYDTGFLMKVTGIYEMEKGILCLLHEIHKYLTFMLSALGYGSETTFELFYSSNKRKRVRGGGKVNLPF